jgi:hypothetical protein
MLATVVYLFWSPALRAIPVLQNEIDLEVLIPTNEELEE